MFKAKKAKVFLMISGLLLLALYFVINYAINQQSADLVGSSIGLPKESTDDHYGVSAGNPYAVSVGMEVLAKGGNAVDAAIAVSYALGVVQPYGSGIGGGGVMLVYPTDGNPPVVYDYLGPAPSDGSIPEGLVGIPGFVLAMEQIGTDFGTQPLSDLIEPSVSLAQNGFRVDPSLNAIILSAKSKLMTTSPTVFYNNGMQPGTGMKLKQPELASTLQLIQKEGAAVFYEGSISKKIIAASSGLLAKDFKDFSTIKREPVVGTYKDWTILSAPPPFAGITLIQILEMAERLDVRNFKTESTDLYTFYRIINTAYKDRVTNIADPAFVDIDPTKLVGDSYVDQLSTEINNTMSFIPSDSEETTHFVIVDKNGMMVSCSNTLSSWFGSGIYVDGFFLNNELANFNQKTYSVNQWEPGKRPRTFMSPTILAMNGKPILGIGTPGGNRIPAALAQVLISILDNSQDPQAAIDAPRFYLRSNVLYYEDTLPATITKDLNANGIRTLKDSVSIRYGAINCLYYDAASGQVQGAADKRRGGTWDAN